MRKGCCAKAVSAGLEDQDQGNRPALQTQLLNYLEENPRAAAADQVRKQLQDLR
jgi:hypothetical protein